MNPEIDKFVEKLHEESFIGRTFNFKEAVLKAIDFGQNLQKNKIDIVDVYTYEAGKAEGEKIGREKQKHEDKVAYELDRAILED